MGTGLRCRKQPEASMLAQEAGEWMVPSCTGGIEVVETAVGQVAPP